MSPNQTKKKKKTPCYVSMYVCVYVVMYQVLRVGAGMYVLYVHPATHEYILQRMNVGTAAIYRDAHTTTREPSSDAHTPRESPAQNRKPAEIPSASSIQPSPSSCSHRTSWLPSRGRADRCRRREPGLFFEPNESDDKSQANLKKPKNVRVIWFW